MMDGGIFFPVSLYQQGNEGAAIGNQKEDEGLSLGCSDENPMLAGWLLLPCNVAFGKAALRGVCCHCSLFEHKFPAQ